MIHFRHGLSVSLASFDSHADFASSMSKDEFAVVLKNRGEFVVPCCKDGGVVISSHGERGVFSSQGEEVVVSSKLVSSKLVSSQSGFGVGCGEVGVSEGVVFTGF